MNPSTMFFFIKTALALLGFLLFYVNFLNQLISTKKKKKSPLEFWVDYTEFLDQYGKN